MLVSYRKKNNSQAKQKIPTAHGVMQIMLTACWLDHDGTVPSSPWIGLLDLIH